MRFRLNLCVVLGVLSNSVSGTHPARADGPPQATAPEPPASMKPVDTARAIERALGFIESDAVKWREARSCATCHHGTMTVWTLNEAKAQGYKVAAEPLAELTQWTKDLFVPRFSKPRDPRFGWNLVSVPAISLGIMSQTLPVLSRDEIQRVATHLAAHQETDGAWILPPPENGAPPIWESRETVALLALLAWDPYVPGDAAATANQASREKAIAWLRNTPPSDTVQSLALRLVLALKSRMPAGEIQPVIDRLLKSQRSDGGWSQTSEIASDAYATGQTLWALSFANDVRLHGAFTVDRAALDRAVAFLVASQREDGSWPMKSRNHPGVKSDRDPLRNPIPITYFGSAWATLGLVRNVPAPLDAVALRKKALDQLRMYNAAQTVDETSADKPVVRVDLQTYAIDDQELATFVPLLQVFPQLATLESKSFNITDAGLVHLKRLPQLRSLTLENAPITDAGLVHLKELKSLRELNIKGTKVTDAGIQELQKSLPAMKVVR